jgi:hypothetical protein
MNRQGDRHPGPRRNENPRITRRVVTKAADAHDKQSRQISFKGALQAMTALQDALWRAAPRDQERLVQTMLKVITVPAIPVLYHQVT